VVGARPATIPGDATRRLPVEADLGPAERWLRSRAAATVEAVDRSMADYAFGEVTRLVYDAIWNEYCDWGLELAKVRLADESLPVEAHEATWWTLVDVLDTYLRLLHPVMPFVTEALWASLPHRATDPELLIVARWPAPGERDEAAETGVQALLELVRGIRNARSEAKVEPGRWLPVDVVVPVGAGATFEALRPAIARLARARPLERRLTREALEATAGSADLAVIVGDLEALVRVATADGGGGGDSASLERARLERELAEAEGWLVAARERLANDSFTARAPAAVVEGARAREAELADQVARLRERLGV
jgi:valyl-tRNA synthetase